jgi:hypothetical protein
MVYVNPEMSDQFQQQLRDAPDESIVPIPERAGALAGIGGMWERTRLPAGVMTGMIRD